MTTILYRIASALMGHVQRLAPIDRRGWARAMAAELSFTRSGSASLEFALGCLWTVLRLRAQRSRGHLAGNVSMALLLGSLFFAHAAVPDTRAWPLIWPAAGGVLSAFVSAKRGRPPGSFAGAGARFGATSALVFFVTGVGLLWWVEAPDLQDRVGVLGLGAGLGIALSAFGAGLTGRWIGSRR